MRLVIQRVKNASLRVDGELISDIGVGLMCFAGIVEGDTVAQIKKAANKIKA